jgi:hypothetical protein
MRKKCVCNVCVFVGGERRWSSVQKEEEGGRLLFVYVCVFCNFSL